MNSNSIPSDEAQNRINAAIEELKETLSCWPGSDSKAATPIKSLIQSLEKTLRILEGKENEHQTDPSY